MLSLTILNSVLLILSLALIIKNTSPQKKSKAQLMFAIFCGSISFLMIKQLLESQIAPYHYMIGIGASATCNSYWLFSRLLFRRRNAIETPHIIIAVAIALLVASNQIFMFLQGVSIITPQTNNFAGFILSESVVLLSSCILVLTFWEACRNYKKEDKTSKAQRLYFLAVFTIALIGSRVTEALSSNNPMMLEMYITIIILFVMLNTEILLLWKYSIRVSNLFNKLMGYSITAPQKTNTLDKSFKTAGVNHSGIAQQIKSLIIDQDLYLKENIKVSDVARELDLPEYIISQSIREDLGAKNFNQYINGLRIKHSQELLSAPENRKKSILAIGFDSGFASVGPFTRTFKAMTGLTPSQYRNSQLESQQ